MGERRDFSIRSGNAEVSCWLHMPITGREEGN